MHQIINASDYKRSDDEPKLDLVIGMQLEVSKAHHKRTMSQLYTNR